jgi:hypothetical protein
MKYMICTPYKKIMLYRPPESNGCQKLYNNVNTAYELLVEKILLWSGKSELGEFFQYWLKYYCTMIKDSLVGWKGIVHGHLSGN